MKAAAIALAATAAATPTKTDRHHVFIAIRHNLPHPLRQRLKRLKGCETKGIPYPSNYRFAGAHDGAYQYDYPTWRSTVTALPRRLRRIASGGRAYTASPAEQDVRTAYFFPEHSGQWECRA